MYHHHNMLWSCMSNSNILKGFLFGGGCRLSSLRSSGGMVSTNSIRLLSCSTTNTTTTTTSSNSSSTKRGFPRIPWLCLSPTYNGRILPVFNPSDSCFYDFPIPRAVRGRENRVCGSGHGWLVMSKSKKAYYPAELTEVIPSLYNPITRAHITLPSVKPPSMIANARVWCNPTEASRGQPLVSVVYGIGSRQILIYNQGDDDWSTEIVTKPKDIIAWTVYHEADAKLYAVFEDGRLSVLDLASSTTLRPLINTPSPEIKYLRARGHIASLVVGAAGDLLLVMKIERKYNWILPRPHYCVFKLDRRCLKWVCTENIGHHTMFVHENDDYTYSTICCPSFTDAQANRTYILKQHYEIHPEGGCVGEATDTKVMIEVPGDVRVCDLLPAAALFPAAGAPKSAEKDKIPIFKTSKILRGPPHWYPYYQFGTWIVPSLS